MKNRLIFTSLFIFSLTLSFGQEVISGLDRNVEKQMHGRILKSIIIDHGPISIPFIDDFSNYSVFPNPNLWIDRHAFINNTFAVRPPTVGVATLDALNQYGRIHQNAESTAFSADSLTSRPIRLDTLFSPIYRPISIADSIYFSFFYQPGGGVGQPWQLIGDKPEFNDSLIVEFGYRTEEFVFDHFRMEPQEIPAFFMPGDSVENHCFPGVYIVLEEAMFPQDTLWVICDTVYKPEVIWEKVWHSNGKTLQQMLDSTGNYFNQVLIPVLDEKYLNSRFQFRFRNYASMGNNALVGWLGNIDQWNIDYVVLDINRSYQDTLIKDVAFVNSAPSILKKHQSMPWNQFVGFQQTELKDTLYMSLTNLDNITKNTSYVYKVNTSSGGEVYSYDGGSFNLEPYMPNGYQQYHPHARPPIKFTLPEDSGDSALFVITHVHKEAGLGDKRAENDTIRYHQKFYNYFSYDDGIPENGYGLSVAGGRLAYRFALNVPDTLQAIQMFFNRTFDNANQQNFYLTVWDNINDKPGNVIYEKPFTLPMFEDSIFMFHTYKLEEPILVSGTFYVGWRQNTAANLNIGFDRNNDASSHIFYNTDGAWNNTLYTGALMIRPMMGKHFSMVNVKEEVFQPELSFYPNPNNGNTLFFRYNQIDLKDAILNIYDLRGRVLYRNNLTENIDISFLNNGLYIIEVSDENFKMSKKLIISK